jgi:hypothetical protein
MKKIWFCTAIVVVLLHGNVRADSPPEAPLPQTWVFDVAGDEDGETEAGGIPYRLDPVESASDLPTGIDWIDVASPLNDPPCDCVRSRHRCRSHWLFSIDYLNWTARRTGWDLAVRDADTDNNIEGPIESLQFENSSGLRTSISYLLGNGWDFGFSYTMFETDRDKSVAATDAGQLWLTRANPGSFNNSAAEVAAAADVDLDLFDLESGYWLQPSRNLRLRGFGGVRMASLDQSFQASYRGGTISAAGRHYRQRTDLTASGLRAGSEANWVLPNGFTLSGLLAGSVLIGNFESTYSENEPDFTSAGNVALSDEYTDVVPVLDLRIGAAKRWGRLTLETGYEASVWFNADRRYGFSGAETINRGAMANVPHDLGFDGFYLRLMLLR